MIATLTATFGDLIPLPEGAKMPPPSGATGRAGDSSYRPEWDAHTGNWGYRLADGVIGLDIDGSDHDATKHGPESIAALEAELGALPPMGPYSTRHGEGSDTRIRLFRVPEGTILSEKPLRDVEIIQRHHRYMVAAPSRLADGSEYAWFDFLGREEEAPALEAIPYLPEAWVEYLRAAPSADAPRASSDEVEAFITSLPGVADGPLTARAIGVSLAEPGRDGVLTRKIRRVLEAARTDGSPGQVEAFLEALSADYAEEYGFLEAERQIRRALEAVIGRMFTDEPEEVELDTAEETPEVRPVFKIVSRSELRNRPKAEWIVEGLVQGAGVVTLAATGGVGKTFLAIDWAACMATGQEWMGRKVRSGRTLFVAAEGIDYFEVRLKAWEMYHGADIPDERLEYVETGFNFSDAAAVDQMKKYVSDRKYDLIVMDTLSQLSAVDSENDASEMAAVYRAARSIREANPGSTVLVVHHLNKGGGLRGSSVIRDNSDAVIIGQPSGSGFMLSTLVEDDGKQKNGASERLKGFQLTEFGPALVITRDENEWGGQDYLDRAIEEVFNAKDGGPVKMSHFQAKVCDRTDAMRKRLARKLQEDPTVTSEGERSARVYFRDLD